MIKYAATVIMVIVFFGCNSTKKEDKIVYIEEGSSDANNMYEGLGKLRLSEYGFFKEPINKLQPKEGVFPYEMNTPLFTDYALKKRFIYVPLGTQIKYEEKEVLDFPVGTMLIKNFYYSKEQLAGGPGKIIETRLLIHEEGGWKALPYIWNEEQTDAFLEITGGEQLVELTSGGFQYKVPNMAQCKSCHEYKGAMAPIGPAARQLNKKVGGENQLSVLAKAGVLHGLPELEDVPGLADWQDRESATLDERARAYLEINCGHCHRPEGPGKNSGLDLTTFSSTDHGLGIYKSPVAAGAGSGGHQYDIVPGRPDNSILVYRMESLDPGTMMPELGRSLIHQEGVELIKEWIRSME